MLGSEGVIAQDTWNGLTEEQQIVLVEASKIASAYNKEISAARELEVLKQLREEGCNVIEITDKSPWKEAAQSIIEDNIVGKEEIYQQIIDFAN